VGVGGLFLARTKHTPPPPARSARRPSPPLAGRVRASSDHFTSLMRLIMSAYFGPYLSNTGLTASWNGFLSATSMILMPAALALRSEEHTSELQSLRQLVCRLLLEKKRILS